MSNDKITAAAREPYDERGPIDAPNPPAARATLADVKPGGMVRLGDQAERARFEEWCEQHNYSRSPAQNNCGITVPERYGHPKVQLAWEAWQAALSAQPSPGGQGDALSALVADWETRHGLTDAYRICAAELKEVLAARQPVESEENVAADTYWTLAEMIEPHVQREGINPDGALPASVHDSVAILLKHWLRTRQPVFMQGCDELRARTEGERAAYMEGLEEGKKIAARQPAEMIAKKVGDYRITVAEDAITVSHGRDIVFAYSAGDP